MTEEQKYIVSLSRAAIFEEEPLLPPENIDWEYIWNKANEQNISGLLADAVLRLPMTYQPHNVAMWDEALMQTIVVMGRKFAEFERMMAKLKENGIEPICLKGIVVKDLYPVPELRTMGDFDVLIEKEQRKAAEKIFKDNGYGITKELFLTNVDNGILHGEVFVTLEEEFDNDSLYWDEKIREEVFRNESGRCTVNDTYHLIYIIVHAAKHFIGRGCGIRNLLDIALFVKSHENIDFDIVLDGCRKCGIEKIFYYVASALESYYSIKIPVEVPKGMKTELFVEYMLSYGIFGRDVSDTAFAGRVLHKHSDGNMFMALFPNVEMLKNKYTYLGRCRLLLPLAWVHRLIGGIFVKKYSIQDVLHGIGGSIRYSKERDRRLKMLDLYSKKRD